MAVPRTIPFTPENTQNVVPKTIPFSASEYSAPSFPQRAPTFADKIWSEIADAAKGGVQQIRSGFSEVQNGKSILSPIEGALKIGAGTVSTIASPLAPITAPLAAGVNKVADKVSDSPAVQRFAMSGAGDIASRAAEDIGNASTIAGAVAGSAGSAPVESGINRTANAVNNSVGSVASQVLGASTGTGAASVREAFTGGQAFRSALRGHVDPETVVSTAQDAIQNIAENRRQAYVSDLGKIGENNKSLDISPILDTLQQKLDAFGIKQDSEGNLDFSRSSIANNGTARSDVQGVYNTLKTWGSTEGDRTPIGIDTLKRQLSDFYSPSGSARALVQAVKSKVSETLNKQVDGYKEMTASYAKASQLLDDIKSATGAGSNAKVDTVFTKLTTAMKADKDLRLQVLEEMKSQGAQPDLMEQIAGMNMKSAIPKGLVGKGADIGAAFAILGHFFNPSYIPMILGTSPRIVGEFVNALGLSRGAANAVIHAVNEFGAKTTTSALGGAPEANLRREAK